MGIHHLQQVLREVGMAGIELELDAGGQERKTLQQALYVRISAFEPFQPQTGRDTRIRLREFRAHLTDELQLAVVVIEKARIHCASSLARRRLLSTLTLPESMSMRVRSTRCWAAGWPHSSASILNASAWPSA